MPLYEYRCPEGHLFELIEGFEDSDPKSCPECAKPSERQISAPGTVKSRGRRRKDIKVRKKGEAINLKRDSGEV